MTVVANAEVGLKTDFYAGVNDCHGDRKPVFHGCICMEPTKHTLKVCEMVVARFDT